MAVCRRGLSVVDRTLIEVQMGDRRTFRAIARALNHSLGTVSDEAARAGGMADYAAQTQAASARGRCGRKPRLEPDGALLADVAALLCRDWSPKQIAGRRTRSEHPLRAAASCASNWRVTQAA